MDIIYLGAVVIGIGIATVFLGWYSLATGGSTPLSIAIGAMSVPITLLGYAMVMEVRSMPLCVYERGITSNRVSFSDGRRRRQTLIPADRFTGIDVNDRVVRGERGQLTFRSLVLNYIDEDGAERELYVHMSDLKHWYPAFLAINRVLGRLIDDDLRESMTDLRDQWDRFEERWG